MQEITQLETHLRGELKSLNKHIKKALKLKGEHRRQAVDRLKYKEAKKIKNLITSLDLELTHNEQLIDQGFIRETRQNIKNYQLEVSELVKSLDYSRNEGLDEAALFKHRREKQQTLGNQREELIRQGDRAQVESEEAVRRALKNLYEMKEIGNTVNIELQRQMQRLDAIYDTLQDTESTMKRALRHIRYFARAVYTDKLLMVLIVLIIVAIVAIIILSAMGKIPQ